MNANLLSYIFYVPCLILIFFIAWKCYQAEEKDRMELMRENPEDPALTLAGAAPIGIALMTLMVSAFTYGFCLTAAQKVMHLIS